MTSIVPATRVFWRAELIHMDVGTFVQHGQITDSTALAMHQGRGADVQLWLARHFPELETTFGGKNSA